MRRIHNNKRREFDGARIHVSGLRFLYLFIQSNWKAHTFQVGDYEIESEKDIAALPQSMLDAGAKIRFTASSPLIDEYRVAYVSFSADHGKGEIDIWDDLHGPSLRFFGACEEIISGVTPVLPNIGGDMSSPLAMIPTPTSSVGLPAASEHLASTPLRHHWIRKILIDYYKPIPAAVVTLLVAAIATWFGLKR